MYMVVEDDTGTLAFSVLLVTKLFACFWKLARRLMIAEFELSLLVNDFKAALNFTSKILLIGLKSLAYGLGVKL